MKKDKIILFYPRVDRENLKKNLPLPFLKIGSELVKSGYKIEIIDSRFEVKYKSRLEALIPDSLAFCVSAMTGYQIAGGLEASKFVKESDEKIPVIWGGWHPSLMPEQTVKNEFIDIIVRGQGEFALNEIISALKNVGNLADIQGISFKDPNGNIVHNPDRPFEDVNKFSRINFEILDINNYTYESYLGNRSIFWNTSQGCPFRCAFCSTNKVYKRKWSGLRAERVLEEIDVLTQRFKINGLTFVEDNFFVDKARVERLCDGLIKMNSSLKWEVDGRADLIVRFSDNFLSLLKKSGCEKIYLGAESGDESVLKLIDKDMYLEDTYRACEILHKNNIIAELFLMVGFPEDPDRDLKKTLAMIKWIKNAYPNHQATTFLYTPYPGSNLFDLSVRKGLDYPKRLEDWSKWSVLNVTTPWVSREYFDRANRLIKFYYPFAFPSVFLKGMFKNKKWGILYRIMHKIARFRVRLNFFFLPLEWHIVKRFYYAVKLRHNLFRDVIVPR